MKLLYWVIIGLGLAGFPSLEANETRNAPTKKRLWLKRGLGAGLGLGAMIALILAARSRSASSLSGWENGLSRGKSDAVSMVPSSWGRRKKGQQRISNSNDYNGLRAEGSGEVTTVSLKGELLPDGEGWSLPAPAGALQNNKGVPVVYVGHTPNYRYEKGEVGKPDQDAYFVERSSDGQIRVCVADGTGIPGEIEANLELFDVSNNYHSGGAAAARWVVDTVAARHEPITATSLEAVRDSMEQKLAPVREAAVALQDAFMGGNDLRLSEAKRRLKTFIKPGYLKGGTAAVAGATVLPEGEYILSVVGDCGSFIITCEGVSGALGIVYGPSLHPHLNGYRRHTGEWRLGDLVSDGGSQRPVECRLSRLYPPFRFLVVACDGFLDEFKGVRRAVDGAGMSLNAQIDEINASAGRWVSEQQIDQQWSEVEKEGKKIPGLTLRSVYDCICAALSRGENPSVALVQAVKNATKQHDDTTVVVVDLGN